MPYPLPEGALTELLGFAAAFAVVLGALWAVVELVERFWPRD